MGGTYLDFLPYMAHIPPPLDDLPLLQPEQPRARALHNAIRILSATKNTLPKRTPRTLRSPRGPRGPLPTPRASPSAITSPQTHTHTQTTQPGQKLSTIHSGFARARNKDPPRSAPRRAPRCPRAPCCGCGGRTRGASRPSAATTGSPAAPRGMGPSTSHVPC